MHGIPEEELTPFHWSAGLVLHPQFTVATSRYQRLKKMEGNKHLWALSYLYAGQLEALTASFDLFSRGQQYCDVELNVYKRSQHGLCLSSFERFNPHVSGFQQLPWMANVMGLGMPTRGMHSRSMLNNTFLSCEPLFPPKQACGLSPAAERVWLASP